MSLRIRLSQLLNALASAVALLALGTAAGAGEVSSSVTLPLEFADNRIILPWTIDGRGPFWMILDTGDIAVDVTPRVARLLRLRTGPAESVGGGTGNKTFTIAPTRLDSLAVGSMSMANVDAEVFDLSNIQRGIGFPRLDGIIGYPVLRALHVKVDVDAGRITLSRAPLVAPTGAHTVPFTQQLPIVTASIIGIPGPVLVDTGDRSSLTLFNHFASVHGLYGRYPGPQNILTGFGAGGPVRGDVFRMPDAEIFGFQLHGIVARASRQHGGAFATQPLAASIGGGVLRRFNVIYDYPNSRIVAWPSSEFSEADVYDSIGMWLSQDGGNVTVASIIPSSPAQSSGIRVGDVVREVNGRPTRSKSAIDVRTQLLTIPAGTPVTLTLDRGGAVVQVALTTRDLLTNSSPSSKPVPGRGPTHIEWNLDATTIASSCRAAIATAREAIDALAREQAVATFKNTVVELEDINADLNDRLVAQTFLSQVSPDRKIRDASLACATEVAAFSSDATSVPSIYRRLTRIRLGTASSAADRALLQLWRLTYARSGAGLPDNQRKEFVALSKELTDLQNAYNQNFANDTTSIEITKDDATGIPDDFFASLKTNSDGKLLLPINDSTITIINSNARSESLRRNAYLAYSNIQVPANIDLLKKAIVVRSRLAHLLGYSSWAAYQMAVRTVTQPQVIDAFLSGLDAHLRSQAAGDVAELAALKAQETGDPQASIEPWDVLYYQNELQRTKYAVDRNEIRQYFPAPHVVDAVLRIYQHLLGVTFAPVTPANDWHPDVVEYSVTDTASGRFIGTFLLDLYPRAGKPGGAFNDAILPVRRVGGAWRPPISAIIVSDWPAPLNGKPALLTHEDVTTFFHEFGHCMAALLTTAPYESLTQFGQDFVEAPSQMLENFTWSAPVLKQLSANVDTGEPIPDGLIAKMIAARCTSDRLCNAYAATRQIFYSDIDLQYHEGPPPSDLSALWDSVAAKDTPVKVPAGAHPAAQFTHLMDGYDAGYYVYLWSLVYAQDMFTAFQKGGLDNPEVGMRYRKTILEPAYIYSPDREVHDFLGRPMNSAAFLAGFQRRS